jgi:hypothetical protein
MWSIIFTQSLDTKLKMLDLRCFYPFTVEFCAFAYLQNHSVLYFVCVEIEYKGLLNIYSANKYTYIIKRGYSTTMTPLLLPLHISTRPYSLTILLHHTLLIQPRFYYFILI